MVRQARNKRIQVIISILLSISIVIGLLPTFAFAFAEVNTNPDTDTDGFTSTEEPGTGSDTSSSTEEPGTGSGSDTSSDTEEPGTGSGSNTSSDTEEPGTNEPETPDDEVVWIDTAGNIMTTEEKDNWSYNNGNIKYIGKIENGRIIGNMPATINDKAITNLYNTFQECVSLVEAPEIPDTVTNMTGTFEGCISLESVGEIPGTVKELNSTFEGCTSLKVAPIIKDGVEGLSRTFNGCTSLTLVPELPQTIKTMQSTFEGCTGMIEPPTIPENVTNMLSTFNGCSSLIRTPVIPNKVTNLNRAFYECSSLKEVAQLGSSINSMTQTFKSCVSLENPPIIPGGVKNLHLTFERCTSLNNISNIPESATDVNGMFYGCQQLYGKVEVPEKYKNSMTLFQGCTPTLTITTTNAIIGELIKNVRVDFHQSSYSYGLTDKNGQIQFRGDIGWEDSEATITMWYGGIRKNIKVQFVINQNAELKVSFGEPGETLADNKIFGTITDSNKPISGIDIRAYNSEKEEIAVVTTSENGEYEVVNLPDGDYTIKATYKEAEKSKAATISANDQQVDIDFNAVTNYSLSGTVTNTKTKDILPGATVIVLNQDGTKVGEATVGLDGKYMISNLPNGEYTIKATYKASSGDVSSEVNIKIDNRNTEIDIELNIPDDIKVAHKITGTVTNGSTGEPLPGATIEIKAQDGNKVGETATKEDGTYEVSNLPDGSYAITVSYPDPTNPDENISKEVSVTINGTDAQVDIELDIPNENYKITGTITNSNTNQPIPGVKILVKDAEGNEVGSTVTKEDGTYEVSNLLNGDYNLEVVYKDPSGNPDENISKEVSVTINGADKQVDIELLILQKFKISGTAKYETELLSNVYVQLIDKNTGRTIKTTYTNNDGKYEFDGLTPGTYEIKGNYTKAVGSAVEQLETTVTITIVDKDMTADLQFKTTPVNPPVTKTYSISGRVTDNNGTILNKATVKLLDSTGKVIGTTTTNDKGDYQFDSLTPGTYRVEVSFGGNTQSAVGVIVDKDIIINLKIIVHAILAYQISGVIKDSNGNPLNGVAVQITDQNGRVVGTATTNSKGYYEVSGLVPGVYKVTGTYNNGSSITTAGLTASATGTIIDKDVIVNLTIKVGGNENPGGKPEDKPSKPEDKPQQPEDKPQQPEDKPQQPEDKPQQPEDKPQQPEDKPSKPEDKPQQPEQPTKPEEPTKTEDKLSQPNTKEPETNINDDPVPGGNKETEDPPTPDDDHKITGIIIDSDTEDPIPGVSVKIKDKDGNEVGPIDTGDDGTFTIPDLPDGEYKIIVTYPDPTNPIIEEVTVIIDHSDEEVVIRLNIPKPTPEENYSVIGEVIDQNDKPLPGTTVDVYDSTGNKLDTVKTDKDGNFILSNLPNGTYTLVVSYPTPLNPDGDIITETIKVTISGEDEKVTIRMNIPSIRTGATEAFNNRIKQIMMISAISLLVLLGIGLLWILFLAWYRIIKVYNNTNTDEYQEDDWDLVYKKYVSKEDKGVYSIAIPEKIMQNRVTGKFAVELKKLFAERHNGDMFIVKIIDTNDEEKVIISYSFKIDKDEVIMYFNYNLNNI